MKVTYILVIAILFSSFDAALMSQSIHDPLSITKLKGSIKIDGLVDEPEWMGIDPLPLTQHWPDFKGEITEPTQIRIAYDDEYVYLSFICTDSEPLQIQTPTFQRDKWGMKMDQIIVGLDTYDDNENTLVFGVTASGSRIDAAIKNDAQGDGVSNTSWNSYWEAKVSANEKGWQAELKIPFSSLRFKVENNSIKMGFIAYRYIARKRELNIYPAIPPDWGFMSILKASQAQTITFKGIKNKRPWYISPYVLAGVGHHHEESESENLGRIADEDFQVGIDVQHALSDNLNADFTLNTDFAQVEADNQVINLSRFSLFFPEKRKFFLERASIFDFKSDYNNNLFYSRKIGINDSQLIPIWGGVRLVGRLDEWDVGLLNMQSKQMGSIASENFGVFRLRKNVLNQRSYIGAMVTTRGMANRNWNFAYGLDGIFNLFNHDYLQVNLATTDDTQDTSEMKSLEKSRIYMKWEKRIINGFGYTFSYSFVGNNFNPGLGFERRKNFFQLGDEFFYSWFAPKSSSLRQTTITLNGNVSYNNSSNLLETSSVGLHSEWTWNRGSSVSLGVQKLKDRVPEAFDLSDKITIQPGEYLNTTGSLRYSTPQVNLTTLSSSLKIGTFYNGNLISTSISPELIFSKYFQMSGSYEYNHIDFPDLNKTFHAHVGRLSLASSLNVKLSFSAFAQINSLHNISTLNFRLRYNVADGNDLYLVYNEVLNNKPLLKIPRLPSSDIRAILIKYIYTIKR
jgi:hypothetical protein